MHYGFWQVCKADVNFLLIRHCYLTVQTRADLMQSVRIACSKIAEAEGADRLHLICSLAPGTPIEMIGICAFISFACLGILGIRAAVKPWNSLASVPSIAGQAKDREVTV